MHLTAIPVFFNKGKNQLIYLFFKSADEHSHETTVISAKAINESK